MKIRRLKAADRKALVLKTALTLAEKHGFENITREQIARHAGVAGATISHHFGDMQNLRDALVEYAIATESIVVIAQILVSDRGVDIPPCLRKRALSRLM